VRTINFLRIGVAAAAVLSAMAGVAEAQPATAMRPYRALFGGSTANPDVHHSFDLTTSMSAGYEDNASPEAAASLSPLLQTGGFLGMSAALGYGWHSRRVDLAASLTTNTRYYGDVDQWIGTSHGASVGVSAQVGQRGRVTANQSVTLAPSYLYSLTPSLSGTTVGAQVGGGSVPLGDDPIYVFDTSVTGSYAVSRRGTVELLGTYRYSDLSSAGGAPTVEALRSYGIGGRYRHGLSKYASLRLGYIYRQGQYGFVRTNTATAVHDIDIGVDYGRALSLTRKTSLDFSTGSALVSTPQIDAAGQNELQFRLVGNVSLTHEMGRTWRARVGYNRGVGFAEAFAQPIFADAFNASLTGFLSRRVDLTISGGFSTGEVGFGGASSLQSSSDSSFRTWNFSARSRYALGSMWALFGEYLFSSQDLGSAVIVPTGVPSLLDRQTVQVGLTFWVPLLRR
jgi:hypothetical protein